MHLLPAIFPEVDPATAPPRGTLRPLPPFFPIASPSRTREATIPGATPLASGVAGGAELDAADEETSTVRAAGTVPAAAQEEREAVGGPAVVIWGAADDAGSAGMGDQGRRNGVDGLMRPVSPLIPPRLTSGKPTVLLMLAPAKSPPELPKKSAAGVISGAVVARGGAGIAGVSTASAGCPAAVAGGTGFGAGDSGAAAGRAVDFAAAADIAARDESGIFGKQSRSC